MMKSDKMRGNAKGTQGDGSETRVKQENRRFYAKPRFQRQLSSKYANGESQDSFGGPLLLLVMISSEVAYLIGRLLVICLNLVTTGYFLLHATVAMFSYLVLGLVQLPVVYGYTTDDKDYKRVAVLVTYLLCVIILATANAYKQGPNKFKVKTVLYYVITASMASGVGLAAGHLIKRLMALVN
ncbi:membrane protein of ER body-like protein [Nicotiana tomentosiformis]|uniref:membrane protein of ER body-like protein n=1 Tax=Nicotiana tomentosiformis TaxID=4098 RepID=UPI00051C33BD|nr:membrane protein of ER body-like protein [Nicotiana tomentosiformis]